MCGRRKNPRITDRLLPRPLAIAEIRHPWGGVVKVENYYRNMDGALYMMKEIAQGGGEDILLSRRHPRRVALPILNPLRRGS